MGNSIFNWANQMIQANQSNFGDDKETQQMIQAIQSGNAKQGEVLANQILKKAGVSKNKALEMAVQKFMS